MEYLGIEFVVQLIKDGNITVVATGEQPDPPLTQGDIQLIVEALNDHHEVLAAEEMVTQRMTHFEVTPNMVAAGLRALEPEVGGQ